MTITEEPLHHPRQRMSASTMPVEANPAPGRLDDALADLRSAVDDTRAELRQTIQESGAAEPRDRVAQAVASVGVAWAGFQPAAIIRCG